MLNKRFSMTISLYLAKVYTLNFLFLLSILLGIVYLFDTVELLRRAAKHDDIPLTLILQMGFFKLPEVGQLIFPFAILFSGMFTFWQLTRRHELVILRSAGFSVWQFMAPSICVALLIGCLQITVINPVGALFLSRFEAFESDYLNRKKNLVSLSEQGLWLRQKNDNNDEIILHASKINLPGWTLKDVIVFFFHENDDFYRRIDAQSAVLEQGQWTFRNAISNSPQKPSEDVDFLTLATDITVNDIENSFSSPETIAFWKLPDFIKVMETTGFDPTQLKIHFQSLLAQPFLYAAMILMAASVSLRPPRSTGTFSLVVLGVVAGFLLFFMSSFLQALGASHQIPVLMAAWSPALICMMGGISIILYLEDG